MAQRLRVLISAYACEPNKGSEPEVGWQWALQMERFHDITVLTRANNRSAIEAEVRQLPATQPAPQFVYHDCSDGWLKIKRRFKAVKAYYVMWQKSARKVVAQLNKARRFDLMHHVTFAAYRYPTALWGHGVPVVWGPVGGIESIPAGLLPWQHPVSLVSEALRNVSNRVQAAPFMALPKRAAASSVILASTREMQQHFKALGFNAELSPAIGLTEKELLPPEPRAERTGSLRLLFVGNLIALKGMDLALEALKLSGTNATLTLVGTGNYESTLKGKTNSLGLSERVAFRGRIPRMELLKLYRDFDAFIFPSLHDTGGYAVIEAMSNELPVICLDCGGPAVAVNDRCGVKVPLQSRANLILALAEAIRLYDRNANVLAAHGRAARQKVLDEYDWSKKGAQMNGFYSRAVSKQDSSLPLTH